MTGNDFVPVGPASSGSHQAETALRTPAGSWFRETGSGMGPMPNTAAQMPASAPTDRDTWISFRNRGDRRRPSVEAPIRVAARKGAA